MTRTLRHYIEHRLLDGVAPGYGTTYLDPHPDLPEDARVFWETLALEACDGGVLLREHGQLIGFCRYVTDMDAKSLKTCVALSMAGTWVDAEHRRQGHARAMWARVLRELPTFARVNAVTVSRGGSALVRALKQAWPKLTFTVEHTYRIRSLDRPAPLYKMPTGT